MKVFSSLDEEDSWRHLALEVMVSLSENAPGMVRMRAEKFVASARVATIRWNLENIMQDVLKYLMNPHFVTPSVTPSVKWPPTLRQFFRSFCYSAYLMTSCTFEYRFTVVLNILTRYLDGIMDKLEAILTTKFKELIEKGMQKYIGESTLDRIICYSTQY